jgi:hypothetical protein
MDEDYVHAYMGLVQGFANLHNLDLEIDCEWPSELEVEFRNLFRELQQEFGREPL